VGVRVAKAKTSKTSVRRRASQKVPLKSTQMKDVRPNPSTIKGAGKGLFAAVDMAKATKLPAPYQGKPLTWEQFLKTEDQRYCFTVSHNGIWAVDALKLVKGNPCRFVNGAQTAAQRRRVNVAGLFLKDKQVWFVTTRPGKKGEEFLIDYGPGYWKEWHLRYSRPQQVRSKIRALQSKIRQASARDRVHLQDQLEELKDELEDLK